MKAAMGAQPSAKVVPFSRRAKRAHQAARKGMMARLDERVGRLEGTLAERDKRAGSGSSGSRNRRFYVMLALSLLFHALLIGLVTFVMPKSPASGNPSLEVVLVNARSSAKPKQSQLLAQHNLEGGGNTDADRYAKTPLPVLRDDPRMSDVAYANKRVAQLEEDVRRVLATQKGRFDTANTAPQQQRQVETQPDTPPSLTADDTQRSLNIQRQEAVVARMWDAYQKRPRRHAVGASASEYRFARYVDGWRQQVEKYAEANYPEAARQQRLYGSLLLAVSIRANGTLQHAQILRSSGSKVLDAAALRIVREGAPYAAFPPDIAKDTDIIDITRTWRYTTSDKVETE